MIKIAIIDDNASERTVLKGLAEDSGFTVVAEGANGQEAVDICRLKSPGLVIMDVKMPVKDGIEAAAEISRLCPTPVVLLTASDDEDTITRAVEAGVMGYLVKPVRQEDITPAIKLAMSRFLEFEMLKRENRDLKNTLQARKAIEKAKGLLMEKEGLSEAAAFARIRKISMDRRQSMTDIAEIIITALEDKKV
ncbi:MAG: response regulator [Deltaproteobacteria bacterium]|nr:response regulator [Deltaproteobacteria bacterium]